MIFVALDHVHNYSSIITKQAQCNETGQIVYTCACGDTYSETIPATGHTYEAVVTAPTCTEGGYTTYTCHCNDTYTADETPATGHNMILNEAESYSPTCTKGGYELYECDKCGHAEDYYSFALEHDMSEFVETLAPTCTEIGEERSNCSRCNYFETRDILATGHDYETVVTKPTCTEKGYTTYTCHCNDTYKADEVDALGHEYRVTLDAPSCTKQGMKITYCINCTESTTETIPILDHTDKDENDYCDVCKEDLDPVAHCSCNCHKDGIISIIWKIINFFNKLFRSNPTCMCGVAHY